MKLNVLQLMGLCDYCQDYMSYETYQALRQARNYLDDPGQNRVFAWVQVLDPRMEEEIKGAIRQNTRRNTYLNNLRTQYAL